MTNDSAPSSVQAGGSFEAGRTTAGLSSQQFTRYFAEPGFLPEHEHRDQVPLEVTFVARHSKAILHAASTNTSCPSKDEVAVVGSHEFERAAELVSPLDIGYL